MYIYVCECVFQADVFLGHSWLYLLKVFLPNQSLPCQRVCLATCSRNSLSMSCTLGLQAVCHAHSAFTWILGIRTLILMLTNEELYRCTMSPATFPLIFRISWYFLPISKHEVNIIFYTKWPVVPVYFIYWVILPW